MMYSMAFFKKRETLVQNIAYMAIMAAINVIFVLLTAILPPLMFLIVFVLPLTSAVVTLFCKKRYFPIYAVVTVALCLLATFGIYIYDTFFYVIPSLITGFVFGLLIEKKVPAIYIIVSSTALQYVLSFLTFLTLYLILPDINFIDALLSIFGLANFVYKDVFIHLFLFTLASIQTTFAYFILKREVKKLGFEVVEEIKLHYLLFAFVVLIDVLALVMVFIYPPLVYVFIVMNLPFMVYEIISLIYERKKAIYIVMVIALVISISIFVGFYTLIPHPLGIILVAPMQILFSVIYFVNYLFNNKTKNDKIDN